MNNCITKPLTSQYSGCLSENPTCPYAVRMGFSIWCKHKDHTYFYGHKAHGLSLDELSQRYALLRQQRIDTFLSGMDESIMEQFIHHEEWRESLAS